jgi:ribosomal protein L3
VQLGYLEKKTPRKDGKVKRGESGHRGRGEANQPIAGHFEKNGGGAPTRHLAEFRLKAEGEEPAGGTSLGVGGRLQGGRRDQGAGQDQGARLRRRDEAPRFKGQKASHGQKIHRKPASNGATDPRAPSPARAARAASETRT